MELQQLQQQQQQEQQKKEIETKRERKRKKKRIEKVKTATLSSLERDILLLFLSRRVKRMNLREILEEFQGHQPHIVLKSIMRLCDYGILLLLDNLTVVLDNIPLLLQTLLHFKRNTTAYMLYFLFRQNTHALKEGRRVMFNYRIMQIPRHRESDRHIQYVYCLYCSRTGIRRIWNAVDELRQHGILVKKSGYVYEINLDVLPQEMREYIFSIFCSC